MITLVGGSREVVRIEDLDGDLFTCWLRSLSIAKGTGSDMFLVFCDGADMAWINAEDARILESFMVMLGERRPAVEYPA